MTGFFHSSWFGWGSAILLMFMLGLLAFLHKRRVIGERIATWIIAAFMLLALLALTVNIE